MHLFWQKILNRVPPSWRGGSPKTEYQEIGDLSEAFAADFLQYEAGYKILAKKWERSGYELDIVAREGDILVFVEVRSRKKGSKVSGYHSITQKKRRSLQSACKAYLDAMRRRAVHFRFDIIQIEHASSGAREVTHFKNITLFDRHFH